MMEESSVSTNMAGFSFNAFVSCNSLLNCKSDSEKWVVDSGANQHMTAQESLLRDTVDVSNLNLRVNHPNGSSARINKIGNMQLSGSVTLFDVFAVHDYHVNILSVHNLCRDSKYQVVFNEYDCLVQDSQSKVTVETGNEYEGRYYLDYKSSGNIVSRANHAICFGSRVTWHSRLGHPSDQALKALKGKLNIKIENSILCEICHKAKQTRKHFPLSEHKSTRLGDLIHLDVWGPSRVPTLDGFKLFLKIVDDFTRATWIYLLHSKTEVFTRFSGFSKMLNNQFNVSIKVIRFDNGTEFVNNQMENFCKTNGILHQTSCAYTPQQNGVVERKLRHLLNVARSLMFESGLPLEYWGEAILTSVFLINRTPTSILNGNSPFELIYKYSPNYDILKVFRCLCFATKLNNSDKFTERVVKCVFLGYVPDKKGYKLLNLDTNSIFISRDVMFYESLFPFKMKSSSSFQH